MHAQHDRGACPRAGRPRSSITGAVLPGRTVRAEGIAGRPRPAWPATRQSVNAGFASFAPGKANSLRVHDGSTTFLRHAAGSGCVVRLLVIANQGPNHSPG